MRLTDAVSIDSCANGGGSQERVCQWNGGAWIPEGAEPSFGDLSTGCVRMWTESGGWSCITFPECDETTGQIIKFDISTPDFFSCVQVQNVVSVSTTTTTTTTTTSTTTTSTTTTSTTTTTLVGNPPGIGCDCQSSFGEPYCVTDPSDRTLAYTSTDPGVLIGKPNLVPETTVSITVDSGLTCGQYANGDFWIVGAGANKEVTVSAMVPAIDTTSMPGHTLNGIKGNPSPTGGVGFLDTRYESGTTDTLPKTYSALSGPVSIVKGASKPAAGTDMNDAHPCRFIYETSRNRSCLNLTGVFTVVSAIPDTDADGSTADEFRPSPYGTSKATGFNENTTFTDNVAALLDTLDVGDIASASNWTFTHIKARYRFPQLTFHNGGGQEEDRAWINSEPSVSYTGGTGYGQTFSLNSSNTGLRFLLNDLDYAGNADHRLALIHYVQSGIDDYGAVLAGVSWNPLIYPITGGFGGIMQGHKLPVLFAAMLFNSSAMKTTVSTSEKFFEDNIVYSGDGGVPYYGASGGACATASACQTDNIGTNCRAPTEDYDAGCCNGTSSYPSQTSNNMRYQSMVVRYLVAETTWNDDPWLQYAEEWNDGGGSRSTVYRLCTGAPTGSGNTGTRSNTGYSTTFGSEMYTDFGPGPP